jgi:tetratricopeptide (TPR) repeat protein
MLVTMQQCFSGGFIDDLTDYTTYPNTMCKNRRVITAADYDESAVMEIHITGGNSAIIGGVYGEFDFYFFSALRGFYPDVIFENGFDPWEISADLSDFPFYLYPTLVNHPDDYDPDEILGNDDGIVQVGEGFGYMDDFDTWSPNGYYLPYPGYTYSEHPQNEKTGLFDEDLFTLTGLAGDVKNDQTVTGNFLIGGNITIKSTAEVQIANLSEFYLQDGNSRIYVEGELNIGSDVLLKGQDESFMSLIRRNTGGVLTFGSGTKLNHMRIELTGYPLMSYLLLDDLIFNNFHINGQVVSIDVTNSSFTSGWMQISNCDDLNMHDCEFTYANLMVSGNTFTPELSTGLIYDCNFSHVNSFGAAVTIENMPRYSFSRNNVYGYLTGLNVFNSGEAKMASVSTNEIHNNYENGIMVYNSHAYMRMNNIRDNDEDGISLHNKSYVRLDGDPAAKYVSQTQRFRDNGMYEIFSDQGSFPEQFRWNAIIDEDNSSDGYELVFCETQISEEKDVRYNYWGSEENFNPELDFYPWQDYSYLPKFKLIDDEEDISDDELLFNSAENNFEIGNYSVAQNEYKQVIELYPTSKFAIASIKQLYSVESYAGNDFNSLKQYYRNNIVILSNPDLIKFADFFANKCDIKLENWQTAIDWFEYEILNPDSYADSLYAVIDLGNTYLLMQQGGLKTAYIGNLTEHIPASVEQYTTKRDYLISLLPNVKPSNDQVKNNLASLIGGELLQNVPNPFNGTTQIWFKLTEESNVSVTIYDYTGKEVSVINPGSLKSGNHSVEFNSANLSAGIYFYSLEVNGTKTDTKKMTLMK